MHTSHLRRFGAASLLCMSSLGLHAAPLVLAGSGSTVDFYFDTTYWGATPSYTISGDRITFNRIGLTAFTSGERGLGGSDAQTRDALPGRPTLLGVARSGFAFSAGYSATLSFTGNYELEGSGLAALVHGSDLHAGAFSSGLFNSGEVLGSLFADASGTTSGVGLLYGLSNSLSGSTGAGTALGLVDFFASAAVFQDDLGDTRATLDSFSYSITAAELDAVPEPASLLLSLTLLAGLALTRRH